MKHFLRSSLAASLLLPAVAQVPVQLRLLDQHGAEIAGSYIQVGPVAHPTGSTVSLPIAPVTLVLQPALPSLAGTGRIARTELVTVASGTTILELEWVMRDVVLAVSDQYQALLPDSTLQVYPGGSPSVVPGTSVRLPVNDPVLYPTLMSVPWPDGYSIAIDATPGPGSNLLGRLDRGAIVTATTSRLDFEWRTATVQLSIVDQYGVAIPESHVGPYPGVPQSPNGTQVTLPITDASLYPGLNPSSFGDGYDFLVDATPGVNTSQLVRLDGPIQVLESTTVLQFEWARSHCALQLLGPSLAPVAGSTISMPNGFPPFMIGDTLTLPVTDNTLYPTIGSTYVDGYPIVVAPGDQPGIVRALQLEFYLGGVLAPTSVEVGGALYTLACDSNLAPSVDAGPNVALTTAQQTATVIAGTAADADGDTLSYRWLVGALELVPTTLVGPAGDAPLALSSLAPLAVGAYELTLEVTDGALTVTDSTIVTIGNAPPVCSCGGAGRYAFGEASVELTATVTDHDADLLSYDWSWAGGVLATGLVEAVAGGAPVMLPVTSISTGLAPGELLLGLHTLVLTVQDGAGGGDTCEVVVEVSDVDAPTLAPVASTTLLWPPNHQLVEVVILAHAADSSGLPVTLSAEVRSSENARKVGSGATIPDFTAPVIDQLTGTIYVQLRAERSGKGRGRQYTVVITATDVAGNSSVTEVVVQAPHDRG